MAEYRGYFIDEKAHNCVIAPGSHDYVQKPFPSVEEAKKWIDFAIDCGAPVDDQPEDKCEHNAYICEHPRRGGFLVFCADCDLTAEGGTEENAIANWKAGFTLTQGFCRGELVDARELK